MPCLPQAIPRRVLFPIIPAGRMGTIDDIAQTALWLADDETSGFINGQLIDVSGGQHNGKLP